MTFRRVRIDVPQGRIQAFCRRHHIRKLAFFGSVLRDTFALRVT
jgi:predicted nucleotidyltransferase